MKHITKFIEYLIESNEISDDDINDFLYPIREDLGIGCEVNDPVTITEGKYAGREYRKIIFDITKLEYAGGLGYADALVDHRMWELFSEIISLKDRLDSDEVALDINTLKKRMGISFITKAPVKTGPLFELEKLHRVLSNKAWEGRSDFTNNMTMKLDKENLVLTINVSLSFTHRKWRLFIRDFDLSDYDVEIKTQVKYDELSAVIKITPKK